MSGLDQNEDVNNIDNLNDLNSENESNESNDEIEISSDSGSNSESNDSNEYSNESGNEGDSNNGSDNENEVSDRSNESNVTDESGDSNNGNEVSNDSNNDEPSDNELDDSNNGNELDSNNENDSNSDEPSENDSNNDNEPNNEEPSENELNDTPAPQPWENAPSDCLFYEKIYDDGHLGSFTQSAELAYKMGWDIEHNYIPIADTEQSDINGWTYRKEVCPRKTQEQLDQEAVQNRIKEIQNAVQNMLDSKAQEKLYDNGFAIASYATSTKESFRTEAQRFVAWRDDVWSKCYEILADFQSGEIDMPSVEYVIERLPVLNWDSNN